MSIPYATPGERPRSSAWLNSHPRNARSRSAVRGIRKSQGSPRRPSPPYGITPTNMERAAPHGKERRARVAPRVARARQAQGLQESNQRVMKRLQGRVNVRRTSHSPEVAHARPAAPHVPLSRHRCSRSEEHTSELQSPCNLVCRLLLEKKKKKTDYLQYYELRICHILQS